MALKLLRNVAERALKGVGDAANSAFNYLQINAPETIDRVLQSNPLTYSSSKQGQNVVANVGRFLQGAPDTSYKPPVSITGFLKNTPFKPIDDANIASHEFISGMLGSQIKSYGQTLETTATPEGRVRQVQGAQQVPRQTKDLFTGGFNQVPQNLSTLFENPAVRDALNIADIFALGSGSLFKKTGQEAVEQVAKKGTRELFEEGTEQVAKKGTRELFEEGIETGSRNVVDDVTESAGKTIVREAREDVPTLLRESDNLSGDLARKLPRAPQGTMYVTPDGTVFKTSKPPRVSSTLDRIAKQANEAKSVASNEAREQLLLGSGESFGTLPDRAGSLRLKEIKAKTAISKVKDVNWYDKVVLPRIDRLKKSLPETLFNEIDSSVITPLNNSLGNAAEWTKGYYDRAKNLNIAPGSQEDDLIRALNSGRTTEAGLIDSVGEEVASRVINAHSELRGMYDEIFQSVNKAREGVGLPEISYKKDFLSQVGRNESSNIVDDLLLGGVSGEKSTPLFKKQTQEANTGAIESFVNYVENAKQAGFIDVHVPNLSKFTSKISEAGADPKVVSYLEDYSKVLLGVKDYGGVNKVVNTLTGKVRAAAVIGNPGTLLSQVFNLPQAANEAGFKNILTSFSKDARTAMSKSPYLKTLNERVPLSLTKGKFKKAVKSGGIALQEANKSVAETTWRMFYEQGKKQGVDDVVKFADDAAVQLMGDRRLGSASQFYESPVGRIVGAFTLENQAAMNRMFKSIGEKKAGTVIGSIVTWHLANKANERFGSGYKPFFDPIQASADIVEQFTGSDRKDPSIVKSIGRFLGETSNLSPALQSAIFTMYEGGNLAGLLPDSRDVFGTEDPTWQNIGSLYNPAKYFGRRITGNRLIDEPINLASKVIPYVNPGARATQALFSAGEGVVKGRSGGAMFPTADNPVDAIRSVLFGQYSTPESQKFFNNEYTRPLSKDQTAILDTLPREEKAGFIDKVHAEDISSGKLSSTSGKTSGLFGRDKKIDWTLKPTTEQEQKDFKKLVDEALTQGVELPEEALLTSFFDGKTYNKNSRTGQKEILSDMLKVADDEFLTPDQKAAIANSAGINEIDLNYYRAASRSQDDRLEGLLSYTSENQEDRNNLLVDLILGKRAVGGKSMFSTSMYDRLYDDGLISKDEKKLISAIKYDPIFNKFYVDRDYKGTGTSASKARSYVKSINSLYKDTFKKSDVSFNPSSFESFPEVPKINLPKISRSRR